MNAKKSQIETNLQVYAVYNAIPWDPMVLAGAWEGWLCWVVLWRAGLLAMLGKVTCKVP